MAGSVIAAMATVAAGTVAVKFVSTAKEMAVAFRFGAGDSVDAFLVAFLPVAFTLNLIAGSVPSAILPTFVKVREQKGARAGLELIKSAQLLMLGTLLGVSLFLALVSPILMPLIGRNFGPAKLALTERMFLTMLPVVMFSGLATVGASLLTALDTYSAVALLPIVTPTVILCLTLAAASTMGIYALAVGTLAGAAIEVSLLHGLCLRYGLNLLPRWHGFSADLRYSLRQYLPMVAATMIMTSSSFVDQAMAASLGSGSVSSYAYGTRAVIAILGIVTMAVSTAVFPHFSKLLAVQNYKAVERTALKYGLLVFTGAALLATMFVVESRQIIHALFVRGAFTNTSAELASRVQSLYALQIPFFVTGMIGVRLLSAMAENRQLIWIGGINLFVDITGNLVFMRWFGISGIALSTSLVYVVSFSMIWGTVYLRLKRKLSTR